MISGFTWVTSWIGSEFFRLFLCTHIKQQLGATEYLLGSDSLVYNFTLKSSVDLCPLTPFFSLLVICLKSYQQGDTYTRPSTIEVVSVHQNPHVKLKPVVTIGKVLQ